MEELEEYYDYENILQRMLDRIPNNIDKREGSVIYNVLAPCAIELAQMYIVLKDTVDLVFVDTATDDYLDSLCNQVGVKRKDATATIKQGNFYDAENKPFNVEIGSRYTCGNLYWKSIKKKTDGVFELQCESAGKEGNNVTGNLIPVDYIEGLATATLTEVLIPGTEQETDEELRKRYYEQTNEKAFGGNIAYYKIETKKIEDVGAVKVFPVWNGGGTVKITILDRNFCKASNETIQKVQNSICPDLSNEGLGIAPIGHTVTVNTVQEKEISIKLGLTLKEGETKATAKNKIEELIEAYFLELRQNWEESDKLKIIKVQLEAMIVNSNIVEDITSITINEGTENIELLENEIPKLKEVVIL